MKRIFKRALSVLLAAIMVISTVPISYVALASAASLGYVVGDIIEFGSYPQSEVTDSVLIAELEEQTLEWTSYGYYSGSGEFGSMSSTDYMKYADIEYGGEKYRAVTFSRYRPNLTYHSSSAKNSNQNNNGYQPDIVYWFKYEPLQWRIIDPAKGIVMSKSLIDSQAYNETVYYYDNGNESSSDNYYLDSAHKTYANDYAEGSLRKWLNDEFYNTAFSAEDRKKILTYKTDNSASSSEYDSSSTRDYVFIPSYDDVTNADFGFSSDTDRIAMGTDYAEAQGLYVPESGEGAFWWLRTPGTYSYYACRVNNIGEAGAEGNSIDFCNYGVRPAVRYDFDGTGERYTATFMVAGEVYDEKSYAVGESINEPAIPEREGYAFAGWDTEIPATMGYENLVFNATWDAISTAVYFMDSEGDQIDCVAGTYGSSINAIDSTKTGYIFEGWYYSDGTPALFPVTLGTEDIYVYARYSIVQYIVCFDADGGSFADGSTQKSTLNNYGSVITLPDTPTKIGFTFVGWNEPAAMPAHDITLTAKWQVNAYDAVFDANGGAFSDGSTQKEIKIDFGAEIVAPENPTRENYVFVGWEPVIGTMDTEGKSFVAVWEISVYKLTYLDFEGNIFAEYDVVCGTELPVPEEPPVKEYYTFMGWTDIPEFMPAADIEIRPNFARVPVELIANENSEIIIDYENMAILGVAECTNRRAFKSKLIVEGDGYIELSKFSNHYVGTGTVVSLYDNVTGENIGDFTVVVEGDLDGNGYRSGEDGEIINDESLLITNWSSKVIYDSEKGEMIPNPEYDFYRFLAADVNKDGIIDAADFYANGFRMYNVVRYIMTEEGEYDADTEFYYEGFGIVGETVSYIPDEALEGFYIDNELSVISGIFEEDTGNLEFNVFYAREKYTFTTVVDGYETTTEYLYGQAIEVVEPEKEGYTFLGWSPEIPVNMPAHDLTVYGAFGVNTYTIVFNADSGHFADGSSEIVYTADYGSTVICPQNPTKEGYIFSGWDQPVPANMPATDMVIFATWSAIQYIDYTVEYYLMDTSGMYDYDDCIVETRTGIADETVIVDPNIIEGFTVDESKSDLSGTVSPDGSSVFKIYYKRNTHTVTFFVDGMSVSEQLYYYGSTLTESPTPQKAGYNFIGWTNTGSTEICAFPITVEGDLSFTAIWSIAEYEVTFDANGGSWSNGNTITVISAEYDTWVSIPEDLYIFSEPTKEGYLFCGWQDSEGNAVDLPIRMPEKNITIYAVWVHDLAFCRVRNVVRNDYETYKEMNALYEITLYSGCVKVEFLENNSEDYTSKGIFDRNSEFVSDDLSEIGVVSIKAYDEESREEIVDISNYNGFYYEVWTVVAKLAEGEHKVRANVDGTDEGWEETDFAYDYWVTYDDVPFDLILDANGGYFPENSTGLISIYCLLYGESIEEYYEEPVRDGYAFTGWADQYGNTVEINGTMPDFNGTVYAKWKEKLDVGGKTLEIRTEILREVDGEWIPTDEVVAGESVKARVYINTDFKAGNGRLLLFYNSAFFEDSYSTGSVPLIMNDSLTSSPSLYGLEGNMSKIPTTSGILKKLILEGYITEDFLNENSAIQFSYNFPHGDECQYLSGDEWFAEFDLTVREDASGTGDVFVNENTFATTEREGAYGNICRQSENRAFAVAAIGMRQWAGSDAVITLESNPVRINANKVYAYFDATYGTFADGSTIKSFEGEPGESIAVAKPDGGTSYNFVGWSLDGTTVVDEIKFLDDDTTYYAVWSIKTETEPWCEYTFDENTGELVIFGEGDIEDFNLRYLPYWYDICDYICSVIIEEGITSIGAYAFYECGWMEKATIPVSVTNIGDYAFDMCPISDVYYAGTEEDWYNITIGEGNACLLGATIHFESSGEEVSFLSNNSLFSLFRNTESVSETEILNLSDSYVSLEYTNAYYPGEALEPVVYLQYGDELFDAKKELAITYSDNNKVGTAKVILEGLNRFSGSAELEFTISYEKVPEQIVNVIAVGEIGQILLSWGISSEVSTNSYNIYRRNEGSDEYSLIKTTDGRENLSYNDMAVEEGKTYIYQVTGVGLYGAESVPSAEVYATVQSDKEGPTVLKLKPASSTTLCGTQALSITAEDNIGIAKAVYSYSEDNGETWNVIGESTGSSFSCKFDTTVLGSTSVSVKVVAYDTAGNASDELINIYRIDNIGPEKVTGLSANVQSSIITLSWNNVLDTDADYFILQQRINGEWETILTELKTRGANIKNLQAETDYTFRVACVDKKGNIGEYSDEYTVRTDVDTMIPAITGQSPAPERFRSAFTYTATAQDNCGIKSIKVQVSYDEETWSDIGTKTFTDVNTVQKYSIEINTDEYDEGYLYVRAIATDISGNESISGSTAPCVGYYIDRTAPDTPTGFKASGADGYINLEWTIGTENDLGGYYIYRATEENGKYTEIASDRMTYNYPDQTIERGKTYYYKIRVSDTCGNMSGYSEVVSTQMLDDTVKPVINGIGETYNNSLSKSYNNFNVVASDNNMLSYMVVEYCTTKNMTYAEVARAENIAQAYKNLTVNIPMEDLENGDKVYVRAYAVDIIGLKSDYVNAQYTVDLTAPSASDFKASIVNSRVTLTWNDCSETDLAGFMVYRSENGNEYTLIGSRGVKESGTYSFSDYVPTSESKTYYYKLEAIDKLKNISSALVNVEYLTAADDGINIAPVASFSCKPFMILNVEDEFDASASTDDSEITEYIWDFGDGTSSNEIKPIKKYSSVGTYSVTLTVKDAEGLQHSVTQTVEVKERENLGALRVRVVDENGIAIAYTPVYFDLGSKEKKEVVTGSDGVATMLLPDGTHKVGAYKDHYLPAKKEIVVLPNATRTITLTMVKGDIITGEFEITRMTFDEIIEAGIDPCDPDNRHVYSATVRYEYAATQTEIKYYRGGGGIISYEIKDGDGRGRGGGGGGRKVSDVVFLGGDGNGDVIAVLEVPAQASFLKEFFDVKLHIINNAASDFVMKNNEIKLNIPNGMTLMTGLDGGYQNGDTVYIDSIKGQNTVTISWCLRGDVAGEYNLTANYTGILDEFEEFVTTSFMTDEPIKVYGLDGVKFRILGADEIHNNTFYFNVELENERPVDVLMPNISLIKDKVTNVTDRVLGIDNAVFTSTAYLMNTYVQLENGKKQYISADLEVLAPGQKLVHEYVAYNAINYDGVAQFKSAAILEFEGMLENIEVGSFKKERYSFTDYSEKLSNILKAEKPNIASAKSYINNDGIYYYVDEAEQGAGLRFLYNLANAIINADPSGFSNDEMKERARDILLSVLTDESIISKIDELTGQRCNDAINQYFGDVKADLEEKYDQAEIDRAFDELYSKEDWLTEKFVIDGAIDFYNSVTSIIDNHLTSGSIEVLQFTPSRYFGKKTDTALAWSDTVLDALTSIERNIYIQGVLKFESNVEYSNFVLDRIIEASKTKDSDVSRAMLKIAKEFKTELNESVEDFQRNVAEVIKYSSVEVGRHLLGEALNELVTLGIGSTVMSVIKVVYNFAMWFTGVDDYMKQKSILSAYNQIGDAFLGGFALKQSVTNNVDDFYYLTLLRAGCETRLGGEAAYKQFILDYIGGKKLDPVEEKEALKVINNVKGTSFSSIDKWYDAVQGNIVIARDLLFNIETTGTNIPSAPVFSLNYDTCQTYQSFGPEYEYCFSDGVWKKCDGNPIKFELETVPQVLRVRVAASDSNLAGKITTERIYAQKELSKLITVKNSNRKYTFSNLSSERKYQMVPLDTPISTPDWNNATYVSGNTAYAESSDYIALRSCLNADLLEANSLPLIIKVQKKQSLDLTIKGDGTVEQSNASGEYFVGDTVDLIATPHESCEFLGWYVDGELVSRDVHYILEYSEDVKVKAEFTGVTVRSIEIETMPSKTVYTVGEKLSTDGMILKVKYSDFSTKTIDSGFICSESVLAKEGEITVTVKYGGESTEFTVNVYRDFYTLTWIVDGVQTEEQHKFGDAISYPETNPEKKGYTFVGWSINLPKTMPAHDLTLTAVFTPISADVTFDADGGKFADGSVSVTVSVEYDSEIPVPETPEKQGYIFAGWGINGENTGTELGVMDSTERKTFVALWIAATNTVYTVETYTMDTDGEYVVSVQSFCGETDSIVNFGPVVETGFELDSEKSVLEGTVKADNSLVLKVYINRLSYTFTVDSQNGSEPVSDEYLYGSIISKPADPEKYGYDFAGWTPDFPDTMPAENLTVTANFEAKTYNAVFIDGEEEFVVTEVTFGEVIPVPASPPEKEGYTFMGWSYDGTVVLDSLGTMDETGKTFNAVWHANEPDHIHIPQTIVVSASCTVDGVEYIICLECGETIGDAVVLPANGHVPGEWETVLEPTAKAEGKRIKKCTVCGETIAEEEISKLAVVTDSETGIIVEYTENNYDGVLEIIVEESFDGSSHTIINSELGLVKTSVYDIKLLLDGKEIQPKGKIIIRLPLPDGYNPDRSFVYHVDSKNVKVEKMSAVYENGFMVFETDHLSYYAIIEEFDGKLEIRKPSVTTIKYGDAIVLHADISEKLPICATIKWESSNGNFDMSVSDDGRTCKVTPKSSGETTFTASIVDANGNEVCSDTQTMTSKAGFFDKIIAFFKKLFGLTKTIPQVFKGIF